MGRLPRWSWAADSVTIWTVSNNINGLSCTLSGRSSSAVAGMGPLRASWRQVAQSGAGSCDQPVSACLGTPGVPQAFQVVSTTRVGVGQALVMGSLGRLSPPPRRWETHTHIDTTSRATVSGSPSRIFRACAGFDVTQSRYEKYFD